MITSVSFHETDGSGFYILKLYFKYSPTHNLSEQSSVGYP